jgi:membrane fusion protein
MAGSLIAYAIFGEMTRKASVGGMLVPASGLMDLYAASAGSVVELRVVEGQIVREGDVLAVLATDQAMGAGKLGGQLARQIDSRRAALEAERALRATQVRLQRQSLAARMQAMDAELVGLQDEIALSKRRVALGQQQAARVEQLVASGFVSPNQAQGSQSELLEAEKRVQQLIRSHIALARDRETLKADIANLSAQLERDRAEVDSNLALLAQEAVENEAKRKQLIVAPGGGSVSLLALGRGQTVKAGQLVASIVPSDTLLQAHLVAPSRTVGFVQVGQQVYLRYQAFPFQKFGLQPATIASVSRTPIAPEQLPSSVAHLATGLGVREALYRLTVDLKAQHVVAYGGLTPLKAGMTLDAALILDRRTIAEWVIAPLVGVARGSAAIH